MTVFRNFRAYLEGLGTTTLLVIGALFVLVTVSSLVGFGDWGVGDPSSDSADLVLDDPAPVPEAPRPAGPASDALAAAAATAAAPAAAAPVPPVPVTVAPPPPPPVTGSGVRDGTASQPDSVLRPTLAESPPREPPEAVGSIGPVRQITRDVAETTEFVAGDLGRTLGLIDPALGRTVGDLGGVVGEIVGGIATP